MLPVCGSSCKAVAISFWFSASAPKTISSVRGGNKLFSGVQINDDATHIFCVLYSVEIRAIEQSNYFILFKSRRFRVLAVTNIDEQDKVLVIQTTERGSCNIEATKA